jgi:hypothetical protein
MLVSESDSEKKLVQLKGLLSLDKPDLERCGLLLRELNIDFLDKTFLPIVDETKLTELHLASKRSKIVNFYFNLLFISIK